MRSVESGDVHSSRNRNPNPNNRAVPSALSSSGTDGRRRRRRRRSLVCTKMGLFFWFVNIIHGYGRKRTLEIARLPMARYHGTLSHKRSLLCAVDGLDLFRFGLGVVSSQRDPGNGNLNRRSPRRPGRPFVCVCVFCVLLVCVCVFFFVLSSSSSWLLSWSLAPSPLESIGPRPTVPPSIVISRGSRSPPCVDALMGWVEAGLAGIDGVDEREARR